MIDKKVYLFVLFILALISVLTSKNISPSYYGLINIIFIFVYVTKYKKSTKNEKLKIKTSYNQL